MQEVKDGNLDALSDDEQIGTDLADLADAPLEVLIAMMLKMTPRLIDSCVMVSNGSVSPDTIAAALQAVEDLDEDHPGRDQALQLLQGAVDTIEERNIAAEVYAEGQSEVLGIFINVLGFADEGGLAQQLAAESEACGN